MSQERYSLVLVVPCFNEASRLRHSEILQWADRRADWLWLLVNDGSTDGTQQILESLQARRPNINILALPQNGGKAQAVREGLRQAGTRHESPWLGYLDADFATPPGEIERLFNLHQHGRFDFVLGSRVRRLGTVIERSPLRHYFGRVGATMISMLLQMPTYDTQCGAKLLRRSLVPILFSEPLVSRWLFDVELLARYRNHFGLPETLSRVIEEPLESWKEKAGSKLRPKDLLRIPGELWRLHKRYNARNCRL
ncbi:glycosyltransferase [bacterium]|nr:glycosyltransferase [bacterium]